MKRSGRSSARFITILGLALLLSLSTVSRAPAAWAESGPSFAYPTNGQNLDYDGALLFKVNPVQGASEYLYGFFQGGTMVWENNRDEHKLSGTTYAIQPGSAGHNAIHPGDLQVWVRGMLNGNWTDATIIDITVSRSGGVSGKEGSGAPEKKPEVNGNPTGGSSSLLAPSSVNTSFCYGDTINLIWHYDSDWDSFRVYKDNERVDLSSSDSRLKRSGDSYTFWVRGPIQHATLGVSAVKNGVESSVTRPGSPTYTCGN